MIQETTFLVSAETETETPQLTETDSETETPENYKSVLILAGNFEIRHQNILEVQEIL